MTDQIEHDALTDPGCRTLAAEYVMTMTEELPTRLNREALLMALVNTFNNFCRDEDLDPTAVYEQVSDALANNAHRIN